MARITTGLTNAYLVFKWLEAVVCLWFLRLFGPFCLGWGLWDLWFYLQGDQSEEREADASIRITAGIILILCWFFLARRKGPWTLNKNGMMERWPLRRDEPQAEPAPNPPKNRYASSPVDKYH